MCRLARPRCSSHQVVGACGACVRPSSGSCEAACAAAWTGALRIGPRSWPGPSGGVPREAPRPWRLFLGVGQLAPSDHSRVCEGLTGPPLTVQNRQRTSFCQFLWT